MSEYEEYEGYERARERALDVYDHLYSVGGDYDDMEAYCISVLDSEFFEYPDGSLEENLMVILARLKHHG